MENQSPMKNQIGMKTKATLTKVQDKNHYVTSS